METERLRLRPLAMGDLPAIAILAADREISERTLAIPHPYLPEHGEGWIREAAAERARGEALTWAVEDRAEGGFLGGLTVRFEEDGTADIGYWLGRPYWNRGYGTEMLSRAIRYAFEETQVSAVTAAALLDNTASLRIQQKAGLRDAGFSSYESENGPREVRVSRLDRADWKNVPPQKSPAGEAAPRRTLLVSAVALVDGDGRVLLAQRPPGKPMAGLWEFPGGKVDPGETPEAALIRELKEELGIDVQKSCLAPFTFASHAYPDFHLLMPLYVCRVWEGIVAPLEGQTLAWVRPNRIEEYPLPPADKPLVAMLRDLL